MATITAYHGTVTDYDGFPQAHTCSWGLHGIYLSEVKKVAKSFAELSAQCRNDGRPRIFEARVDISDALDLSATEMDIEELIDTANNSDAPVIILPDLTGTGEREILVVNPLAAKWTACHNLNPCLRK